MVLIGISNGVAVGGLGDTAAAAAPPRATTPKALIALPNGNRGWFDASGHLVNDNGDRVDVDGRTTRARGQPGRGFVRRNLEAQQRNAAAAAAAAWAMQQQRWQQCHQVLRTTQ